MPFTPFHFGPALGLGLPLRKHLHVPTFLVANVIVDVEPLLVLVLGVNYPLHGYLHTFIFASLAGLAFGYVMFSLDGFLYPLYEALNLVVEGHQGLRKFVGTAVSGTVFYVLLDASLYSDIKPLYPVIINPFYNPGLSLGIYTFCAFMGIVGIFYYVGLFIYPFLRK